MFNTKNELVKLHGSDWFEKQKVAGQVLASILNQCIEAIENGTPDLSLRDLESIAFDTSKKNDCTLSFLNYGGSVSSPPFPSGICTSVNENLVHGVVTDYVLKDGDVVTVDLGVTYKGAIADAAYTAVHGGVKDKTIERMLKCCNDALYAGIEAIKVGEHLGCIGNAIHNHMKGNEFNSIVTYGGHGIDWDTPHAQPFVANKANKYDGVRIQPGLAIAIEPMLTLGPATTKKLDDGWTIATPKIGCHFEHSLFVEEDGNVCIITDLN